MSSLKKITNWLSSLKVAIALLIVIAIASALGTAIPQGEIAQNYLNHYNQKPLFGLVNGEILLLMNLDHIYSSYWFLFLLFWLGLALIICSWRRQWPLLQAALRWIDYKSPRQINKLFLAQTIHVNNSPKALEKLTNHLQNKGWEIKPNQGRLAARKGVIGRVGPPLIHLGLILLMIGSVIGVLNGQKVERFLTPGRSVSLLEKNGNRQLTLKLNTFNIQRDSLGRPEQFKSELEIDNFNQKKLIKEISVNHPLRFRGITIYQADWSLSSIRLQLNNSPKLQLPLTNFPELGDQIWGVVVPTTQNNQNPILISLSNEKGPIKIFNEEGLSLATLFPGQESKDLDGFSIQIIDVIPSSGILIKRDPGVPIVYSGFAIILIGGILSIISTRQLWAISESSPDILHIGGLCNRNLSGFSNELPKLLKIALEN